MCPVFSDGVINISLHQIHNSGQKSEGWGGGLQDYIVSPSPIPFPLDFRFWIWIWDLDLGLGFGTGLGLDN